MKNKNFEQFVKFLHLLYVTDNNDLRNVIWRSKDLNWQGESRNHLLFLDSLSPFFPQDLIEFFQARKEFLSSKKFFTFLPKLRSLPKEDLKGIWNYNNHARYRRFYIEKLRSSASREYSMVVKQWVQIAKKILSNGFVDYPEGSINIIADEFIALMQNKNFTKIALRNLSFCSIIPSLSAISPKVGLALHHYAKDIRPLTNLAKEESPEYLYWEEIRHGVCQKMYFMETETKEDARKYFKTHVNFGLEELPEGAFVAGGFWRAYAEERAPCDVDVYFKNVEAIFNTVFFLWENEWEFLTSSGGTFVFTKEGCSPIQLVCFLMGSHEEILSGFDFQVVQIAIDNKITTMNQSFPNAFWSKKISEQEIYKNLFCKSGRTLSRMLKYYRLGYTFESYLLENLFKFKKIEEEMGLARELKTTDYKAFEAEVDLTLEEEDIEKKFGSNFKKELCF